MTRPYPYQKRPQPSKEHARYRLSALVNRPKVGFFIFNIIKKVRQDTGWNMLSVTIHHTASSHPTTDPRNERVTLLRVVFCNALVMLLLREVRQSAVLFGVPPGSVAVRQVIFTSVISRLVINHSLNRARPYVVSTPTKTAHLCIPSAIG